MKPEAMKVMQMVAIAEGLNPGMLGCVLDSLPKGSTPNRYKPHQGCKEMERRAKKLKGQS